ncbi:MAG TPA: aminoacyl-histidine dipeptidase [Anaerolineales bacterium]|jgi:dipeptidase D
MEPTEHILTIFERLSSIPRGSGREADVSNWLQGLAREHGYASQVDAAGNLVIRVPATAGREAEPIIVLQGHMDMVCEKTPDSTHDFIKDPIRCIVDGDWLHADRTTLGADNGIAIALALALVSDPDVAHAPLELLFTVQEEVGLGGANDLQPGFINGKILVNLDSEDEGTFIIGCAGGQTTQIHLPLMFENTTGAAAFHLKIGGLRGGHSGVDIHKHYASANKLLARVLERIRRSSPLALIRLTGGTAHNAISREAEAFFTSSANQTVAIQRIVREMETIFKNEFNQVESGITLSLTPIEPSRSLKAADSDKAIWFLSALPHGIIEMSASVEGFVETSNNLAKILLDETGLSVVTSQRSTVMSRMDELSAQIQAIAALAGAELSANAVYPAWQPDMKSTLLKRSVAIYQKLFGRTPEVRMIHAGLECGTIGSIYPGMEMISIGATIENPHSPTERMYIPSVERIWRYLVAFLNDHQ